MGVDAIVPVIGHHGGLGETLGFIVDGARSDGVDVAPVGLNLRMHLGVAVALGGGGVEESCAIFSGEVKGIDGAGRAYQEGLDPKTGVIDGAGRGGEVEDEIDLASVERLGNVAFEEAEAVLACEMTEIVDVACAEVIDSDY
jgi:hypothetical protein